MNNTKLMMILFVAPFTLANKFKSSLVGSHLPDVNISKAWISEDSHSAVYFLEYDDVVSVHLTEGDIVTAKTGTARCHTSVSNVSLKGAHVNFSNCSGHGSISFHLRAGHAYGKSGLILKSKKSDEFQVIASATGATFLFR